MKKQIIATLLAFSGLTASFTASAKDASATATTPQPLMTQSQIQEYKALHSKFGVSSISNTKPLKTAFIDEVNKRLENHKTPEDKLLFVMSLNNQSERNLHVNDNLLVKLNEAEQNYFDTYYTFVLDHLNKEISYGKRSKDELIAEYEKTFPFKIYENDLEKFKKS